MMNVWIKGIDTHLSFYLKEHLWFFVSYFRKAKRLKKMKSVDWRRALVSLLLKLSVKIGF